MGQYVFTSKNKKGMRTSGIIEASDKETAIRMLADRDLIVTRLTAMRPKKGFLSFLGIGGLKLSGEEVMGFTQQIAAMLDAGIPLKKAMDTIIDDTENSVARQIFTEISNGLSEGFSFSELLIKYPKTFSRLYVSMVAAGEAGGQLSTIMYQLADYIEKSENLKRKVTSSLYYPAVVISFAFAVMFFILAFGIPIFKGIYSEFGRELPWLTSIFITVGSFISSNFIIIIISIILLIFAIAKILETDAGRTFWDGFKLNLIILGPLYKKVMISRFSRTLSILYSSGVPLLNAMELVAASCGNRMMEKIILASLKDWEEGASISEPLRKSQMLTAMAITMIATGEESGALTKMLDKLTDFYESQVEISLLSLTGLLEPLIMIIIGIFIGVMIVAVGVPFLNLSNLLTN